VATDQFLTAVRSAWANVPPAQRWWGGAITGLVIAALVGLSMAGRSTQWAVLYSRLTPEEASQVITALETHHVPFRPGEDGTSILVPPDRLAATRLQLAGEGLPTGIVGFGVFDHLPLGASDTVERVDYMRALEGQLTQAVESLGQVQSAQVMIALPQSSTYTSEDRPAQASVMVRLQPGAQLSGAEVKAITHLVASSVQGLTPEHISVVDDRGRLLAAGTGQGDGTVADADLQALQRATEQRIHDQIASLVDAVAGPGRSVIQVHADVSGTQVHTVEDQPSAGVPVSQQAVHETYTGGPAATPPPAPVTATGRPPIYGPAAGPTTASNYERSQQTTNYEVGRRRVETKDGGGQVNRLAVTVFVDNAVGLTTASNIQKSIMTGFLNPKRGDTAVVTRVPFWQATAAPAPAAPGPSPSRAALPVAVSAAVGAAILLVIGVMVLLLRRRRPAGVAAPVAVPEMAPTVAASPSGSDSLVRQVVDFARRNPAVTADRIRSWLAQNGATDGHP